MLRGWEPYRAELPGLIMRHSAGGVSVETTGTAENLVRAEKIEQEREPIRERAYACIAHTEVPDDPRFPDGPNHLEGKLLRFLWETQAKTKQKRKALFAEI